MFFKPNQTCAGHEQKSACGGSGCRLFCIRLDRGHTAYLYLAAWVDLLALERVFRYGVTNSTATFGASL